MCLLEVDALEVSIALRHGGTVLPVRDVALSVSPGETLAVVGESGCGKSMTCLALAGLLPRRARISRGAVRLEGTDLTQLGPRKARLLRRRAMASVFQDATNGLNPVRSIGWQIAEAMRLRRGATRAEAEREAVRLLGRVGLPEPEKRAREFPHQFSGGMNQRAMIALAIAGRPKLLIADEATTALDVTIQAQILDLIADLQAELSMGVIFVTHDLGVVAQTADRVAVMYAGRVVETATVRDLFAAPRHPYTNGLLGALPRIDRDAGALSVIEGVVPALDAMPPGCAFAPRCPRARPACAAAVPPLLSTGARSVACIDPYPERRAA
jgi:oligopeptide/dipeptide ABC transporter ATP-binding protein